MNKDRAGLREIVSYEKSQMLPLNFTVCYILTPIYAVISFALIAAFGIFMEIDDQKYLVHGLSCLGAFVLLSIAFLACIPLVRKKTIHTEMERYDFDISREEALEIYDFSSGEFSLKFDKYGIHVDDELTYYNHLDIFVMTSNYCKRVEIYLQFSRAKEWFVTLSLNPTTLKMLECFEIPLANRHVLEYILSNTRDAFAQIYDKGYVIPKYFSEHQS